MTHLFLSPHYDDAILSCGSTIHQLITAGETVEVRTVFGGIPHTTPDTAFIHELHARWGADANPIQMRIQEDEEAMWRIGATASRMIVWPDCVYRVSRSGSVMYPDRNSIFADIHPEDQAARIIPTVVLEPRGVPTTIYAPVGAGHHVDHQIVRNWAVTLREYYPWVALKFYEEYPYNNDTQAVNDALGYLRHHHPNLRLQEALITLSEADIQAKLQAMACYRSQISSFWTDKTQMDSATRESLMTTGKGVPAERFRVVS